MSKVSPQVIKTEQENTTNGENLLEGKTVDLRIIEKEDLPLYQEWINNPDFYGEYDYLDQKTRTEIEKKFDGYPPEKRKFIIQKKDGTRIGGIEGEQHSTYGGYLEIGFTIVQEERGKGYCSEAVKIMVDYLFLSNSLNRIQAVTDTRNLPSQRVLEKAGFMKEGLLRKTAFIRGDWRDLFIYSILREEWKEPKILARASELKKREQKGAENG
jgi:RimJ/RimL family protein N-acetyltransferase